MRRIAVLDAPSNLGLRPPTATSVPGCAKAPGALRDHDLIARLGARDAGCLTPPRYDPGDWRPGDGVCHAQSIAAYSRALADRIGAIIDQGEFPVVLGGDCSILLGAALAMHRLGEAVGGRIGLAFVDGHSDFRHPGNASYVGAAAGEDLALVTGRGQADLTAIEGRRPYFRDIDVVVLGIRAQDEYRLDLQAAGIVTRPVPLLRAEGAARSAQWAHEQLADCAGYWVHVDVDVLDPAVMPAVDAPDAGGIAFPELEQLLAGLVDTPHCLGVEITVFDPDYDPDGAYAAEIVSTLVAGLAPVYAPTPAVPHIGRASVPASSLARKPAEPRAATSTAPAAAPAQAAATVPVAAAAPAVGKAAAAGPGTARQETPPDSGDGRPEPLAVPTSITVPERLARRRRLAAGSPVARAAGRSHDERTAPAPAQAGPARVTPLPSGPALPASGQDAGQPSGAGPDGRPQPGAVEPVGPPASAGPGRLRRRHAPSEIALPRPDPDSDPAMPPKALLSESRLSESTSGDGSDTVIEKPDTVIRDPDTTIEIA